MGNAAPMEWELSKENYQPLKKGRDPGQEACKQASVGVDIKEQKRCGKRCIGLTCDSGLILFVPCASPLPPVCRLHLKKVEQYSGDDPLEPWLR